MAATGTTPALNDASATTSKRLEHTTACLPLVYGSVAFYLGKKADEFQTHQWTLYVRGPNHEDLSGVIAKVVFQLHASFAQPVRELESPPFEVTERGWGEFEAQIRIFWKDPLEKATLLAHGIKLYPAPDPKAAPGVPPPAADVDVPVVAETYDEVVFTDPTEKFYRELLQIATLPEVHLKEARVQQAVGHFADEAQFLALLEAKKFLEGELISVKERFLQVEGETRQVDHAILEIQEKNKTRQTQQRATAASKKQKT